MDRLIHLLWGINQQRTKNKVNSGNHPRVALFIDLISRKSTLGRVLTNPSEPVELPRLDVRAEPIIKTKGVRSRQTFSSGRWIWPFRSRGLVFQKWMFKPLSIRYALRQLDKSDRRDWRKSFGAFCGNDSRLVLPFEEVPMASWYWVFYSSFIFELNTSWSLSHLACTAYSRKSILYRASQTDSSAKEVSAIIAEDREQWVSGLWPT